MNSAYGIGEGIGRKNCIQWAHKKKKPSEKIGLKQDVCTIIKDNYISRFEKSCLNTF